VGVFFLYVQSLSSFLNKHNPLHFSSAGKKKNLTQGRPKCPAIFLRWHKCTTLAILQALCERHSRKKSVSCTLPVHCRNDWYFHTV